ncbi:MAG: 4Fe-4S binding protein [Phycisphaerae bacterium]
MAGPPGLLVSTPGSNATPVAHVDEEACTPCGACQAVCPTEAITLGESAVKVNAEACCGCGACVEVCPNGAIRLN